MSDLDFAKAVEHVSRDLVQKTLTEMVDIPSATGNEIGMARYLVERMQRAGLETELQLVDANRPNAVGHLRGSGTGTNLLFTGHMDTSYSGGEDYLGTYRLLDIVPKGRDERVNGNLTDWVRHHDRYETTATGGR